MSSDVSMKNKGHCKMDYSRSGPRKGVLKRHGLNSSTNHRSQPIHKGDGSLRLQDEDSPVRERAKPFSHNPSFRRGGSKKRTRNEDLEDHLEVNSSLTDIHTNDPQSEEHIGSTSNGTTVTRKETRALSAAKRNRLNNRTLVFEVDDCVGCIVGYDSQIFITKGGCLVRERAKFDETTWRKQEPSLKIDIISKCVENTSFNGNCKSMVHAIDTQLASQHKSRRWRLHNHYKTYPTKEQAIMNPPRGVKVPDWVLLCERFASEDFQKISTRNKLNWSKNEIPPANGTKSMARVIHMKTKQGEKVTAIGGFKICHFSTKKNGMINDKSDEIRHDLQNEEANSSSTPAEICMEKLGYILGHLKGRSASKRIILENESLQRELQLEKEKTKKLQIHINKIEKKHNNLKQKVDYLMKHLPHLSGWQSQGQESEEYVESDDDDDGDDDDDDDDDADVGDGDDDDDADDGQEHGEYVGPDDGDDGQEHGEYAGPDDDRHEHEQEVI